MMIITRIALSDMAHDNTALFDSLPQTSLLLASHTIAGSPKLVWCNWLEDACWQDKINLSALAQHYKFDSDSAQFVPVLQLNAGKPEQQLLLTSITQIQQYLRGSRQDFDLPIDASLGTAFQRRVWQALQQDIEYGQTISYATLAQRVGSPKGCRAVANANSKNPLSVIIPCHRVISSDGKLGGYTGGVDKKQYLLAIEGVACKN